jgi:hypothetical protein
MASQPPLSINGAPYTHAPPATAYGTASNHHATSHQAPQDAPYYAASEIAPSPPLGATSHPAAYSPIASNTGTAAFLSQQQRQQQQPVSAGGEDGWEAGARIQSQYLDSIASGGSPLHLDDHAISAPFPAPNYTRSGPHAVRSNKSRF